MSRSLTLTEWEALWNRSHHAFLSRAVVAVTPFSGISSNALAHLREDWISWRDDFIRVSVPKRAPCNNYKLISDPSDDTPAPIVKRSKPCSGCKAKGEIDQFENTPGKRGIAPTSITLHREIAEPAIDFLEMVFKTYGRSEIAASPSSVSAGAAFALRKEEEIELGGGGYYTALKRTAPVIYAHYGLSAEDIAEITPYKLSVVKNIVSNSPVVNFTKLTTIGFLRRIRQNEPVTVGGLADELGYRDCSVRERLSDLQERERVRISENEGLGKPATRWETTGRWNDKFQCCECDFTSRSVVGIEKHKSGYHRGG